MVADYGKICKHDINTDALLYKLKINMWYTMYDFYLTSFLLLSFNQVHNQLRCRFPSRGPIISPFLPLSLHHFSCPTLSIPFSSLPPPSPRQSAVQGQAAVSPFLRGRSNSDRDRAIGEREREIWVHSATPSSHHYLPPASSNAPGLVKIYGDALSSGANYRSLLANINSTARQLIQQVIIRYTERERENESEDTGISFPVMVTQSSQSVFCKKYASVIAWPQLSKFKKAQKHHKDIIKV